MKRAEISMEMIVILLVLIASFAILLLFLFRLNLSDINQEQLCHDSVIKQGTMQGSTALKAFATGNLECKTKYICLSSGSDCQMTNPDKTINLKLSGDSVVDKNLIFGSVAEEMANCWWMFGEGKVDYSGEGFVGGGIYCGICSVVAFDSKIQEEFNSNPISYLEFKKYLAENKMKDSEEMYLNYLYKTEDIYNQITLYSGEINFTKDYMIITAISNDKPWSFFPKTIKDKDGFAISPLFVEKNKEVYNHLNCQTFVTTA